MSAVGKRILVVDDDPDILLVLTAILEDAGYTVLTADATTYQAPLRDHEPPDLILLDMLLSGHDGRDITRQLKGQEATNHIPIIMLSAHPTAQRDARDVGADGFMAKPFEMDDLLATVAAALR